MIEWLVGGVAALGSGAALGYAGLRRKGLDRWLLSYLRTRHLRRDRQFGEETDVLLCICDHFEPKRGNASPAKAQARIQEWLDKYPALFDRFRDADGRPPQHTFFYPQDEYEPELVEMTAKLCRAGYGEVEIHLHHDNDTAEGLRQKLLDFKKTLHQQHGLLSRDKRTGEIVYGFIHGNWALNNSRRDGRWCGVNNELGVLRETGCYADFTMPSAPDETQTSTINQLYWALDRPNQSKSHDRGLQLGIHAEPKRGLLMVQGPLLLDWKTRKFEVWPAIENGNLQKNQPPTENRFGLWLRASVKVATRPNWLFVKLHTHGLHEPNQDVLLGPAMTEFHEMLQRLSQRDMSIRVHYVTARELVNLALAAVDCGNERVDMLRGYRYTRPC